MVKGFGRRPIAGRERLGRWAGVGVRKPPKDETAGRIWRSWVGGDLWGFEGHGRIAQVAVGAEAGVLAVWAKATGLVRGWRREGLARAWHLGRVWGPWGDSRHLLGRAATGENERRRCKARSAATFMTCRS